MRATETGIIRAAGRGKDALVELKRDAPDGSHLESLNARMARADRTSFRDEIPAHRCRFLALRNPHQISLDHATGAPELIVATGPPSRCS